MPELSWLMDCPMIFEKVFSVSRISRALERAIYGVR